MLLQTLVQLNILFLAAPALAGWVASPVAHPMFAQAAQAIFQPAVWRAEATPRTVEAHRASGAASQRSAVTRPFAMMADSAGTSEPVPAAPAEPAVALFNPFPQATRAP